MSQPSEKHFLQNKKLNQRLEKAVKIIRQKLKPEKIMLYGSYAEGKADKWSDIDLIIISNNIKQKREVDRTIFIDQFLRGTPPIQPFIFTPKEYQKMLQMKSSLLQYALPTARIIYKK